IWQTVILPRSAGSIAESASMHVECTRADELRKGMISRACNVEGMASSALVGDAGGVCARMEMDGGHVRLGSWRAGPRCPSPARWSGGAGARRAPLACGHAYAGCPAQAGAPVASKD